MDVEVSGTELSIRLRKRRNSSARCLGVISAITWPEATSRAARRRGSWSRADVVVGAPLGNSGHQRQHRRAALKRLDLGLLIDAEHHGRLGGIEVEPDDVSDLVDELRIGVRA
jgi:hypothetical protein